MALTPEQLNALADHGITSQADFDAMRPEDQQAMLVDTPDDTQVITSQNVVPPAPPPPAATPVATPAPTPAPASSDGPNDPPAAPAPSQAPTPAPTPAPAAPAQAPAEAPAPAAAAPAPAAPAPAPAPWRVVQDAEPIALPDLQAPPQIATAQDGTKKTELRGKLDELFDKFAEGEITKEQYQKDKGAIEGELDDVNGRLAAQMAADASYSSTAKQAWSAMVADSIRIAKAGGGIDYDAPASTREREALDAAVRRFAQASMLMHPNKSPIWRDRWSLLEAHKDVAAQFGKTFTVPAAAPGAASAPAPAERAAPDLSRVPPTLGGAPEAAAVNVKGDEFAHMDSMSPADAEKAVARMDPATLDRYLAR